MAEETTPNAESKKSDDHAAQAPAAKEDTDKKTNDSASKAKAAKTEAPAENKNKSSEAADKKPAGKSAAKGKAAGKKAKKPDVEDKPFNEFIAEDFIPALEEALAQQEIEDVEINFVKQPLVIAGAASQDECWQVIGKWQEGQRQFNLYFLEEDIKGQKAFSYTTSGAQPSTLESFMIDERRVKLDLLVLYVLQRLNGQKWLVRN